MIPEDLKYTKDHEWVKIEGDEALVGITDHAQSELGDITFIELPEVGREVKQTDSISTVESVKAASDVYSPVTGKIAAVNETLNDAPETLNQSPYEAGWICRISVQDAAEIAGLMDAASYSELITQK